jgi:PAS domain-containing protein
MQIAKDFELLILTLENAKEQVRKTWHSCLNRMHSCLNRMHSRAATERMRLREALSQRANLLQRLLADPADAVVLTNDDRRLVVANPQALTLFGVSGKNMREFAIDAFVPDACRSDFDRTGPPFLRGRERLGECEIRRLDGRMRTVEFIFQSNFVPGRHLSIFHEIRPPQKGPK